MTEDTGKTTHFGFTDIPETEKAGRVRGVFGSVASKYDVMNDAMSMGIHRIWKDAMMDWLAPRAGQKLLDVAGGTGDIAFRFLKRAGSGHATVLDLTEPMLIEGRKRAEAEAMAESLEWIVGRCDGAALRGQHLRRLHHLLRHPERDPPAGGSERSLPRPETGRAADGAGVFSQIPNPAMQWAYDRYSFNVIPAMGQVIANDRDSYQYLVESIRKFPDQETFLRMVRAAGFEQAKFRNLTMGVACLHSGWKL